MILRMKDHEFKLLSCYLMKKKKTTQTLSSSLTEGLVQPVIWLQEEFGEMVGNNNRISLY